MNGLASPSLKAVADKQGVIPLENHNDDHGGGVWYARRRRMSNASMLVMVQDVDACGRQRRQGKGPS